MLQGKHQHTATKLLHFLGLVAVSVLATIHCHVCVRPALFFFFDGVPHDGKNWVLKIM